MLLLSTEACEVRRLLANDAVWRRLLTDAFWSSFLLFRHVLALYPANCEPRSTRDLWKDHAVGSSRTFEAISEGIGTCLVMISMRWQIYNFKIQGLSLRYCYRSHFYFWAFISGRGLNSSFYQAATENRPRKSFWWGAFFNLILQLRTATSLKRNFGAILLDFTSSTASDTFLSTSTTLDQSQFRLYKLPHFTSPSNLIFSIAPVHPPSSSPFHLLLLDAPSEPGKSLLLKSI